MVKVAAGRCARAALAAASLSLFSLPAAAQDAGAETPLDPSAPLAEMPGLGIDWPDMAADPADPIADVPDRSVADAATELSYTWKIAGIDMLDSEAAIRNEFVSLSTLEANRDDPANAAQIDRRADEDSELLAELMRAHGHYDAFVTTAAASAGGRIEVTLQVEPGPLYTFAEVRLPGLETAGADEAALRGAFGIEAGEPVDAAAVQNGQAALRVALGERGYAFADVGTLDVTVNHETRTATLALPVTLKGARRFGKIVVEGRPVFSARHVQEIARFEPGEPYEQSLMDDLRRAIIATGIVSTVDLRAVPAEDPGVVDIAVALEPAPMRTIAGEAGYGTGEGARVEVSWQHRNLLPPEGAVTFRGVAGLQEQMLAANLRRGNFRERDQVLTAQIAASHIDRAAYDARTFLVGAGIERQTNIIWQKTWTWSLGADLIASDERDVDIDTGTQRRRTFFIGALPASLSYDGSNDLLDPTDGFRLSGRISPELSLQSGTFGYTRVQVDGSVYQPVSDNVVIAARTRLGTILGARRDRIAPSRRFYAGGGASVRGFGYQDLGPRDPVFDDPIGGRSLAEFSLEARVRFGNFGVVPFLDAGNIYTSSLPHIDDLRFGAGIGVRYHTNFGPIRLDVGTPLGRRSGEPRIAVYVSLGQAF